MVEHVREGGEFGRSCSNDSRAWMHGSGEGEEDPSEAWLMASMLINVCIEGCGV